MRGSSRMGRGAAVLAAVVGLVAATLAVAPPAGAAKVTAFGPVLCGAAGKVTFTPPLSTVARAGTVMSVKANLGCLTGNTGNPNVVVRSGRLVGTSAPFTASCRSLGFGALASTVKWKADGGTLSPTTVRFTPSATSAPAMSFDLVGTGAGSYPGQVLRAHVVGDGAAGGLCGAGAKKFGFSGTKGTSLVTVGASSNAVIFEDRFDGSSLDKTKWRPNWVGANDNSITKPVNTSEQSCYDPAQVSVSGGVLHLKAAQRACVTSGGNLYPYASGLVESNHKFTFTYGRIEARVWLPPGAGAVQNWPAFWANGTGTWPTTGELNVVEGLGGHACWHFHSSSGGPGSCAAGVLTGWHTFAADWRPGSVTYFYDGVEVGRITSGITGAPMYLVLNLGISSVKTPPVVLPSEMLVDYVRVTR